LEKFGKSIEKSKIENLVTLLQLTPLVGFLAMAEKIRSTRSIMPKIIGIILIILLYFIIQIMK
jgi:uncharacterized protein YybS (DUF2232 family)